MKSIVVRSGAIFVLAFLLMPGLSISGQTPYSQPPPDEISVRQARHALTSASKYGATYQFHHATFRFPPFVVDSSSIVIALDSIEFDATSKKKETKHFRIDLKNIEKVSATCNEHFCDLETKSVSFTIQDKEAVQYWIIFGWDPYGPGIPLCQVAEKAGDCPQSAAWFAAALNSLHAFARTHPAGSGDFHLQAAEWRGLTAKPPVPEEVRVRRLLAEDAVKNHKPVEALNEYEIGLEFYPTWPEGHFNAALIAAELACIMREEQKREAVLC